MTRPGHPLALFPEARRRELFPFVRHVVHLSACAETALPRDSLSAMEAFHRGYATRNLLDFPRWLGELDRCRATLARLIGADDPDDIALVPNTAAAARSVAHSLRLAPGDWLATGSLEFPSNLWPFEDAAEAAGAHVVRIEPEPPFRTPLAPLGALLARLGGAVAGPRAIAWSWVQYRDGYRIDPGELGRIAAGAGALSCLDGIQGLGAVPFSLRDTPVDALYAGGHKWLMGLGGGGFLYLRRSALARMRAFGRGWLSAVDPFAMDPDSPPRADARRFEAGNLPFGHYVALRHSVELLLSVGLEAVFAHILALQDRFLSRLSARGWKAASSLSPAERGPILALTPPAGVDLAGLVRALEAGGILVSARAGCLRIGPHLYNTGAEIDLAARAVADASGSG